MVCRGGEAQGTRLDRKAPFKNISMKLALNKFKRVSASEPIASQKRERNGAVTLKLAHYCNTFMSTYMKQSQRAASLVIFALCLYNKDECRFGQLYSLYAVLHGKHSQYKEKSCRETRSEMVLLRERPE